jgi:phosphatidate cytidylyltransferase
MGDLGPRVAVAAVGIPAILALLYFGGWVLGVPLAVMAALGSGEVYALSGSRGVRPFRGLGAAVAGALVLLAVARPDFASAAPWALGLLGGLMAAGLTLALGRRGPEGSPLSSVSVTLFGAAYCGLVLAFVPLLHALPVRLGWGGPEPTEWAGMLIVALPLSTTWIGDAAAYFAGTTWGRAKLFPEVSPNKSWVGAWAGVLGSAAAAVGWFLLARSVLPGIPLRHFGVVVVGGALLGVGAVVGDLAESLLKREAGVKDAGSLFPGHGGVLDRLDALAVTLPLAYLLLMAAEVLA